MKDIVMERLKCVGDVLGVEIKLEEKLARFIANKIDEIKKGDMRMVF